MRKLRCALICMFALTQGLAQNVPTNFSKTDVTNYLNYLASDELAGRRTASAGGQLAAGFIEEKFKEFGAKPAKEQAGYQQRIPFIATPPITVGSLAIGESKFLVGENMLVIKGFQIDKSANLVFANYGWVDEAEAHDDYAGLDVKGKIVIVNMGLPKASSPGDVFNSMAKKQQLAAERGALALIEIYRIQLPWSFAKGFFGKERLEIDHPTSNPLVYGWVKEGALGELQGMAEKNLLAQLKVVSEPPQQLFADNIVGVIEGTDPVLREEFVLLSAHYDHVGVGKQGGAPYSPQDSIFNGARDNGMGTVALLAAAKSLAASPPKRSVILLACTAEELGMLGSQWYVDNPWVPLSKTVFNLNTDGAGYNSTGHFNIIGLGKTNADEELAKAGTPFGLEMLGDPAPEQNLYQRSDNISFANKGVPAVDMAPGIIAMNDDIFKYYHQAADNPDSVDGEYLLKYCQAFEHAARLIANKEGKLGWK